ncbi:gamma-glutamylcyclotransferase family protein [Geodermatophilus sp. SYSU D00758]
MHAPERYLAYGSNMADPALRGLPGVCSLGAAAVPGHRLRFGRASLRWQAGAADVVPAAGCTVWGELLEVDEAALTFLDAKEGVAQGWYRRAVVPVRAGTGAGEALTYVVVEPARVEQVPRPDYLQRMVTAARELGLPAGYQVFLRGLLAEVRAGTAPGRFRCAGPPPVVGAERY